jgi:hypothetical protein
MVARTLIKAIKSWPDEQFSELVAAILHEQARRYKAKCEQAAVLPRDNKANAKRLAAKN